MVRAQAEIFDVPGQAVIGTELDGTIVYWSDGAKAVYGWEASEVMGRDVVTVTPSSMTVAQAAEIMKALRNGNPWSGNFKVRRRDGLEFDVHVRDLPVRNAVGELIGIIGITARSE